MTEFPGTTLVEARKLQRLVQDSTKALGCLWQGRIRGADEQPPLASWGSSTSVQKEVVLRLGRLWREWLGHPAVQIPGREAFFLLTGEELGRRTSQITGMLDADGRLKQPRGVVVDAVLEQIALPEVGTRPVPIVDVCPIARHYFAKLPELMLRDDKLEVKAEQEAQECYCDPLFDSVEGAFDLALRLLDAGMIGFTDDFQEAVSLFTVVKGYDEQNRRALRPVCDERRANLKWKAPPWVPLGSPAAWTYLDLSDLGPGARLFSATGDMPSFFSRLETPATA